MDHTFCRNEQKSLKTDKIGANPPPDRPNIAQVRPKWPERWHSGYNHYSKTGESAWTNHSPNGQNLENRNAHDLARAKSTYRSSSFVKTYLNSWFLDLHDQIAKSVDFQQPPARWPVQLSRFRLVLGSRTKASSLGQPFEGKSRFNMVLDLRGRSVQQVLWEQARQCKAESHVIGSKFACFIRCTRKETGRYHDDGTKVPRLKNLATQSALNVAAS